MQGGKNWFLPKEMNANRFFWDSHWLEIWSNHLYPSMGPNEESVAMDSGMTRNFVSQICRKLLAFSVGHSNTRVVIVIAVFYFIQVLYHLFVEKLT
jgi:hypothetical protein